jgi:protein gp37
MAENSKIEWTDHTFNPWIGCQKISDACDNCYAATWDQRFKGDRWGPFAKRTLTVNSTWFKPLKWNRDAISEGVRKKVFCASLADIFDNHHSILSGWRKDLWQLIRATPNLDWQLLTKRPQNIEQYLPDDWSNGYKNVWLGITAENQLEYKRRWKALSFVPCKIKFLSCEPLLGPIDLHDESEIDWIIIGGESGSKARPMNPQWADDIVLQCEKLNIPVFFKQWGEWAPKSFCQNISERKFRNMEFVAMNKYMNKKCRNCYGHDMYKVGKKNTRNMLHLGEYHDFPLTKEFYHFHNQVYNQEK